MLLITSMHMIVWIFLISSSIPFLTPINIYRLIRYILLMRLQSSTNDILWMIHPTNETGFSLKENPIGWDQGPYSWPFDVPKSWNDFSKKVFSKKTHVDLHVGRKSFMLQHLYVTCCITYMLHVASCKCWKCMLQHSHVAHLAARNDNYGKVLLLWSSYFIWL